VHTKYALHILAWAKNTSSNLILIISVHNLSFCPLVNELTQTHRGQGAPECSLDLYYSNKSSSFHLWAFASANSNSFWNDILLNLQGLSSPGFSWLHCPLRCIFWVSCLPPFPSSSLRRCYFIYVSSKCSLINDL
jgi:hypothetical protein